MSERTNALKPFGFGSPWLVLAMPAFAALAEAVVRAAPPGTMELMTGSSFSVFPDGTPNIKINAGALGGRDVVFIGSPAPNDTMEFFSVAFAVPRYHARSFVVVVPYFATGTMERVEVEGEVATAKTLARMISATPNSQAGAATVAICDIHALATRFFFSDDVKIKLFSAVPALIQQHLLPADASTAPSMVIAFPDEGAHKRFKTFFAAFEQAVCVKRRDGDARVVQLAEGNVAGRDVLIVDDLVQSGGTLRECRVALLAAGAKNVSAYVTHAVFPRASWEKFLVDPATGNETATGQRGFTKFFVTDSVPATAAAIAGKAPFAVMSLSNSIANLLTN